MEPDDPDLPKIIAVHTTCPAESCTSSFMTPFRVYGELDRINLTAASLYVAVGRAGKRSSRVLDLVRDVFWPLDWFHNWADNDEALADVLVAAALLEQHGWLSRQQTADGTERWTVLGRDRPRITSNDSATAHDVA